MEGTTKPKLCQRLIVNCTKLLFLLSGVDLRQEHDSMRSTRLVGCLDLRRFCVLSIRLLLCIQLTLFNQQNYMDRYSEMSTKPNMSSSDVVKLIFVAIYPVVHVHCLKCLWTSETFLGELLTNPSNVMCLGWRKLAVHSFCWTVCTAEDIVIAIEEARKRESSATLQSMVPMWCGLLTKQGQYLIFIVCSRSLAVLRWRLGELYRDISVGTVSPCEVLKKKHIIRQLTANVNKTFSTSIALLYVKVFLLFYVFLSSVLLLDSRMASIWWWNLSSALQILMLYDLASDGNEIADACHRTAAVALGNDLRPRSGSDENLSSRLAQILSFDEFRDAVKVFNCFLLNKQSFFSYMALIVTCNSVILQFDYRISAKLDENKVMLKSQAPSHENLGA